MTEQDIQNLIRVALSPIAVVFRINTGTVKTVDGRFFSSGTPKGYTDVTGHRKSDGKAIYLEVKTPKGKLSSDQVKFRDEMLKYPIIYGVARSPQEAVSIVEEEVVILK